MKIEKIDRIAISVSDLDEASHFYSNLLGTKFDNIEVASAQNVRVKAAVSPLGLELVEQPAEAKQTEHLRSIVFKVPDLQSVQEGFAAKGLKPASRVSGGELDEIVYVIRGIRLAFARYDEEESHPAARAANKTQTTR